MNVQDYLDEAGVNYRLSRHDITYTAQDLAAAEHIPGRKVIKPVVVKADGQFVMCALPASHRVDLDTLRNQLQVSECELAGEQEMSDLFDGCEIGAEPPIGRKKVIELVAAPMSRRSTEFCTAVTIVCMVNPRPAPNR